MSCCGQSNPKPPLRPRLAPSPGSGPSPEQRFAAILQYIGQTGLTVIGPITGRTYRFAGPGSRERVDLRDRAGLLQIPALREI
jgi:hypothetical protein